jgi:hypothetical protein
MQNNDLPEDSGVKSSVCSTRWRFADALGSTWKIRNWTSGKMIEDKGRTGIAFWVLNLEGFESFDEESRIGVSDGGACIDCAKV